MKRKNSLIIAVTTLLSFLLVSTAVWAGSKQRHRWEGVAIGVGATVVASALINHHTIAYHGGPSVTVSYHYRQPHRNKRRHVNRHRGHRPHKHGAYHRHWRSYGCDRNDHYRGHRRNLRPYSTWRKGIRHPYERGYRDGNRGHDRRRGAWHY